MDKKTAMESIPKIVAYMNDWILESDNNTGYTIGAVETVAHIIACIVTQNITGDSTPTVDIIEHLSLYNRPSEEEVRVSLEKYYG